MIAVVVANASTWSLCTKRVPEALARMLAENRRDCPWLHRSQSRRPCTSGCPRCTSSRHYRTQRTCGTTNHHRTRDVLCTGTRKMNRCQPRWWHAVPALQLKSEQNADVFSCYQLSFIIQDLVHYKHHTDTHHLPVLTSIMPGTMFLRERFSIRVFVVLVTTSCA